MISMQPRAFNAHFGRFLAICMVTSLPQLTGCAHSDARSSATNIVHGIHERSTTGVHPHDVLEEALRQAANGSQHLARQRLTAFAGDPQFDRSVRDKARTALIYLEMRQGRYREALGWVDASLRDNPSDANLTNLAVLLRPLSAWPAQKVIRVLPSRSTYSIHDGNLFLPIRAGVHEGRFLLDTGANFSLISATEATRIGLHLPQTDPARIGDSSGQGIAVRVAVADRFEMAGVSLENVVFLVIDDTQPPFSSLPLGQRGVIGLPVIVAMNRFAWDDAGGFSTLLPAPEHPQCVANLRYAGMNVVASARLSDRGGDLDLFVDTGATHTVALPNLATKLSPEQANAPTHLRTMTGVGGSSQAEAIWLDALKPGIDGVPLDIGPIELLRKSPLRELEPYDLWLGMDVLQKLRRVRFDFECMRIEIE